MSDLNLAILISAVDNASSVLGGVGSVIAGIGVAAIGTAAKSVQMAGDFQASMNKVQALAGLTKTETDSMGQSILDMAGKVGQSPQQLSDGLFFLASAGFRGKDALDALRISAQMAATGQTDLKTTSNALSSAMLAFGYNTSQSAFVANQMTVAISNGKMTMEDYANSIGKLALTAHGFHISMAETNAGLDVLTNHGFPSAAQASTGLNNLFSVMDGRTDTVTKNVKKLGLSFDENKFKSMDLSGQVQYLNQVMQGHTDQLQKVLGGNRTAAQAFQALAGNTQEYQKDLVALNGAQANGGAQTQAFAVTQQGFNQQMAQAKAATDALMIRIGTALLPILTQLTAQITPLINNIVAWMDKNNVAQRSLDAVKNAISFVHTAISGAIGVINGITQAVIGVVNWYKQWSPVINAVGTAITVFFLPALIKAGIEAAVSGAKITASFITSVVQSGVESVVSAAKVTASFVTSLVQAGIEGWASASKIGVFITSMITTGAQAVANAAKVTASFIASMISAGAQAAASAARIVASFVASMITAGAQAIISAAQIVASFVASLISAAAEAVISAGIMLATLVPALIATAVAALAAAAPFILVGLVVAAVVIGIILAIQHWSQIVAWFQGIWQAFTSWFQGILQSLGAFFTNLWNSIVSIFQSVWNNLVNIGKILALALFIALTGPIGLLVIFLVQHWDQVTKFFTQGFGNLVTNAENWGKNLIQSFINGILSMLGNVGNAVSQVASKVAGFLGFHSPAREGPGADLMNWGPGLIQGFSQSVQNALPTLDATMKITAQHVAAPFTGGTPISRAPVAAASTSANNTSININIDGRSARTDKDLVDMMTQQLSRHLRQQSIAPRYTSGGTHQ